MSTATTPGVSNILNPLKVILDNMQILFMKEIENTVVNRAIIAQAENIIFYNM